jgi:DUF4097 and DUF4098 domain-containing protein YvlB
VELPAFESPSLHRNAQVDDKQAQPGQPFAWVRVQRSGGPAMHPYTLTAASALWIGLMLPSSQAARPVALEGADCSRISMMFGDDVVGRAVRYTSVPLSVGVLDVQPESNGGVEIERGAGSNYLVTACIGAGAATAAEARAAAEAVRLVVEGGRVRVENDGRAHSWSVHLIVEAPENARIQVQTSNGPIGVSGVSGEITARSSNGPIGLNDVRGRVSARAQNGPIGVTGSRGDLDIQTDNGPISIILTGTRWEGRLDARAHNGPLKVEIPDNYQSGVEVTSTGRSPWQCGIAACTGGRSWDDDSRTLRVGGDPVVVRVATANGPVTVRRR